MPRSSVPPNWTDLPDEELMKLRLTDLPVRLEGTVVETRIAQLRAELDARGLKFPLHFYFSDDWFTPDGTAAMAVPFYLAHPRLERLEKAQMLAVEGGEHEWCMRILRHEAGHVIDNAYKLRLRRQRRALFGKSSEPYPEFYAPKPYSKSFVMHLDPWYAQSHPDEDFAETFAVWLTPGSDWKTRYAGWPALKKLEYMDGLMQSLVGKPPLLHSVEEVDPLSRLNRTLRYHYRRRAPAPRRGSSRLLRSRSPAALLRGARTRRPHHRRAVPRAPSPARPQDRRGLDRHLPVHHRQSARRHHPSLPRTEAPPRHPRRPGPAGIHRAAHRAGDELPAQRASPGGAVKPQRVLTLVHKGLEPPEQPPAEGTATAEWRMEYDVVQTLRALGHELRVIGVHDDLTPIRSSIDDFKPSITFNLMEAFNDVVVFDQNVVSYLELLRVPYTGCNPRGLTLSRDKALAKKLMAYHRIPVPDFLVVPLGRKALLPKRLKYPLIVKSLTYESSTGISQASVVENDDQLHKRVQFVHDAIQTPAIVEQFIDGRELYVGVMGNDRLQVFPVWEMSFSKMPENSWRIATERVKWSVKYQKKHGIDTAEAGLPEDVAGARAAPGQARLQGAGPHRLRARRPAHDTIGRPVRDRSQPESAAGAGRGFRRVGPARRRVLRPPHRTHHRARAAVAAVKDGVEG